MYDDRAVNQKQYAEILGIGYSTFRSILARHPEDLAPAFEVGGTKRWWVSTISSFHKSKETGGTHKGIEDISL